MEKISPRIDIAFKKIFGVEENKDLLISLINSIVSPNDKVSEITLLNPYNAKNFKKDKLSILDIKAQGMDGKKFNIEIQITDEADYDKRALYYWAKLYAEQLQARGTYSQLNKAIGIHILNFLSIPEAPNYHNVFHITERDSGFLYFKDLELHTIELKKFTNESEELVDLVAKVKSSLDVWSAFLTRHDLLQADNLPAALDNPGLKKALSVLDVMNFNKDEREAYEAHLKWMRTEASGIKKAASDALAEGIEIGKTEGIEIGEDKATIRIVKNMLTEGASIDMIVKVSGLTKEQIEKL